MGDENIVKVGEPVPRYLCVCDLGGFGMGENIFPQVHRLEGEKLFNVGIGLLWWTCGNFLRLGGRDFDKLDDV